MAAKKAESILEDLQGIVTCPICRDQLLEPKLLPCQHGFCRRCLDNLLLTRLHENTQRSPSDFHCPACRRLTFLPLGGVCMLPADIRTNQILGILRKHQALKLVDVSVHESSKKETAIQSMSFDECFDVSDDDLGVLMWEEESENHIWDVDFLNDGSVMFVDSYKLKHLSNLEGAELQLPFNCDTFRSPCSVGVCHELSMFIVADWYKGNNEGFFTIYRESQNQWESTVKQTDFQPSGVTIAASGDIIMTGNEQIKDVDYLVKYNPHGGETWRKTFPNESLGPYVAVHENGDIYISTPTKNSIDIYNSHGEYIRKYKSDHLREPRGLCFTSHGQLIIADYATSLVSLFDMDGGFLQELVHVSGHPNSVSVYQDKYLAITDWQHHRLFLYDVNIEHARL